MDSVYVPSDAITTTVSGEVFIPPLPVLPVFLDLPLITGEEDPLSPAIAVAADPWPGRVALYAEAVNQGYDLVAEVAEAAIVGETLSELDYAAPNRWDRGAPLRVRISGGTLASAETNSVLSGANLAALGVDGTGTWEVFQFATADLVDTNTFDLSMRLRGQYGTENDIATTWPVGTRFVVLNEALKEVPLGPNLRGIARDYRIGSASRPWDDQSYVSEQLAFNGVGLRPHTPVHARAVHQDNGDIEVSCIRRSRLDGDQWGEVSVPLNEAFEAYLVRVFVGSSVVREETIARPAWVYSASAQANNGASGAVTIAIAQISDRFGPGPFAEVQFNV